MAVAPGALLTFGALALAFGVLTVAAPAGATQLAGQATQPLREH